MPKFNCTHCSQSIDAPEELAGTAANCPTCGGAITVPASESKKSLPPLSEEAQHKLTQQDQLVAEMAKEAAATAAEKSKLEAERRILEEARLAEIQHTNANLKEQPKQDRSLENSQLAGDLSSQQPIKKQAIPWRLIVISCVGFLLIISKIHIISGGGVGIKIALRDSFGFRELFINADEITGMPWFSAKSRFPLGCRVLQRKGYIESDSEYRDRNNREVKRNIDEAMENVQQEYEKLMREYE